MKIRNPCRHALKILPAQVHKKVYVNRFREALIIIRHEYIAIL